MSAYYVSVICTKTFNAYLFIYFYLYINHMHINSEWFWILLIFTYITSHEYARQPKLLFNVVCWDGGISVLTFQPSSFNCFHLYYRVIPSFSLILYLHYKIYKLTLEGEKDIKKEKNKRAGKNTLLYLVYILKNILLRLISDIHLRIWIFSQ